MNRSNPIWLGIALGAALCLPRLAPAHHADVLLQDVNKRLTTGSADFDSGQWMLGKRVYTREFDSDYAVSDPGFNALAAGSPSMPAGSEALPGGMPLSWDFLPMNIDGVTSNLFYWDGAGGTPQDVHFGALPGLNYELSLFGRFNAVGVDGAPALVPGDVIDNTAANGSLHTHRFFFLDDGDENPATTPADGIYLISMRVVMAGLDSSLPFYAVWGTPASTLAALVAAESWVDDRVDQLAPDFDADFDGDLDVDGADFLVWQRNQGMSSALQVHGDADRDRSVGASDLTGWSSEFGLSLTTFPGAVAATAASGPLVRTVPEPHAALLALTLLAAAARRRWSG